MSNVPRQYRLFLWIGPVIALNLLLLAFVNLDPSRGTTIELATLGLCFGIMFAHTTVAAAWSAFGPTRLVWRLPLSMIWIVLLALGFGINMSTHGEAKDVAIMFGGLLLAQWLLLQIPLWGVALGYGIHLQHWDEQRQNLNRRHQQFGLRQLLTITTVIGVICGLGRWLVSTFLDRVTFDGKAYAMIGFLGIVAIIVTLPFLLAVLLRRHVVMAVVLAAALIVVVTYLELPLLKVLFPGPGVGAPSRDLIAINAGAVIVMLLLLTIVRLNGYSLATSRGTN